MPVATRRELLEAGVHFGHQTRRWNPKMRRFIFGERSGIYIIDLEKTLDGLSQAYDFLVDIGRRNGIVLFVGTKKQAQETVAEQAGRVGMPYVITRWVGGLLTNFQTVNSRLKRLIPYDTIAVYLCQEGRLIPKYVNGENFRLFSSLDIPIGQGLSGLLH